MEGRRSLEQDGAGVRPADLKERKVYPNDICTRWMPRRCVMPLRECWFCRYADFHLTSERADEIGTCRYPSRQLE